MDVQWSNSVSGLGRLFSQHTMVGSFARAGACNDLNSNNQWSHALLHSSTIFGSGVQIHSLTIQGTRRESKHAVCARGSLGRSGTLHFCGSEKFIPHANSKPKLSAGSSHVVRSSSQGSTGKSLPEDEDSDGVQDSTAPISDGMASPSDDIGEATHESDWRAFRAKLVASEQVMSKSQEPDGPGKETVANSSGTLTNSWAHALPTPEAGCVLVATEKLDGQVLFERTVILLLRVGSNKPREGPLGIILNRPISQTIGELEPTDRTLANTFGKCQVFLGGPLESNVFLLMWNGGKNNHFEEVIPGIYYGGLDGLQHAGELVRDEAVSLESFRFYVGYAGWGLDQLTSEIARGLWCVAACSPDLIRGTSAECLWQEILMRMGGHYADLSKKPKGDGS